MVGLEYDQKQCRISDLGRILALTLPISQHQRGCSSSPNVPFIYIKNECISAGSKSPDFGC
jgi:hypothetical protein